jgi:hypothetical protein
MEGRRLFCFALQSRARRRKKVATRPLREGDRGAARTLGQISSSKDATGRPGRDRRQKTGRSDTAHNKSAALAPYRPRARRRYRFYRRREGPTPAVRVDGPAVGVAGKDAMAVDVTLDHARPHLHSDLCEPGRDRGHANAVAWVTAIPIDSGTDRSLHSRAGRRDSSSRGPQGKMLPLSLVAKRLRCGHVAELGVVHRRERLSRNEFVKHLGP